MRGINSWYAICAAAVLSVSAIACDDDDTLELDARPSDETPAAPVPTIDDLTTGETKAVAGLSATVDVVYDNRGAPHIYAQNLRDAFRANGYVMARDRFPQMEFIRRSVTGTLTEVLAPVAGPNATLQQDQDALFFGFRRIGQQVYDTLPEGDIVKVAVDNYVAGVNDYIAEIRLELAKGAEADLSGFIPAGAGIFRAVLVSPFFRDWEPADVMAIARYQTFVLSFADDDVQRSLAEARAAAAFPTPEQGMATFLDMISHAPGRDVVTTDQGAPGLPVAYPARTAPKPVAYSAQTAAISGNGMRAWVKSVTRLAEMVGGDDRGSNNWVVAGEHTASGSPIMSNDPHLSLSSPAIWYYMHIKTRDEGVDTSGVAFAGLPSIVLGYNRNLAWGATVTNFDVVDFYQFAAQPTESNGEMTLQTVDGQTITATAIEEQIRIPQTGGGLVVAPVRIYPSGPDNKFGQIAMSYSNPISGAIDFNAGVPVAHYQQVGVKTINTDPSNELGFFLRLLQANTIADAREAQATYFQAGSQNFVFVSSAGDIAWQTYSRMPIRPEAARNWDGLTPPNTNAPNAFCPTFVFPAADAFAWTGNVNSADMPSLLNPEKGWIATANQDSIGVTRDNNPCNDGIYVGGDYDPGYREYRIAQRLTDLTNRGNITVQDMQTLQAASRSSLGESMREPIMRSLARAAVAGGLTVEQTADLVDARDRLAVWNLETPTGVGTTDQSVIANSVATTIFNVGITRIIALAFGDEATLLGARPPAAQLLDRVLAAGTVTETSDGSMGLLTYNATLKDSILWDDVSTTGTVETRDQIIARAFIDAYAALRSRLGPDKNTWTWGQLHRVILRALLPITGPDVQSIPAATDLVNSLGFPRHADWGAVDVGNFDLWNAMNSTTTIDISDFAWGSGASQRLVVEMLPEGPVAYNALPGGQSQDPSSPHHADEAALWTANEAPRLNYTDAEVATNAELKMQLTPAAAQ